MKTEMTVDIDDELLEKVQQSTRIKDQSDLVEEALTALLRQSEAARRLAEMGGTQPHLQLLKRRLPEQV